MSKQLIERLRGFKDTPRTADNLCHEAADRIEELERANQHLTMTLADAEALEIGTAERCDALQADNAQLQDKIAELVAALERMRVAGGSQEFHIAWELAKDVLDKVRKP